MFSSQLHEPHSPWDVCIFYSNRNTFKTVATPCHYWYPTRIEMTRWKKNCLPLWTQRKIALVWNAAIRRNDLVLSCCFQVAHVQLLRYYRFVTSVTNCKLQISLLQFIRQFHSIHSCFILKCIRCICYWVLESRRSGNNVCIVSVLFYDWVCALRLAGWSH